ncbi:4-hydroxybenzoate polyprenyltransferase [Prauserella marina]|uniref:4-hydroxybenzoate polyprenyltransferase n=1 Tax=Prauserella marina TaxID=530584 RepID=A0A1G6JJU4_9PSEU|nr:UbiA family prenyltransferase [Prauserella marina]PWV84569.1 4-hydroxybenzoate polyprenyltransferase [Prauserella marina]SDC18937.1 4-hydroxybenzoate polyprenyltransferase [Prauserella marina]
MTAQPSTVSDLITVHRLTHPMPIMLACYGVWGACFAAIVTDVDWLLAIPALVANMLFFAAGLALNTVADAESDKFHGEKRSLAFAVGRISPRNTLYWAIGEILCGLGLVVVISVLTGRWQVLACALAIVAAHLAYNLRPLRLKHRGWPGSVVFGLGTTTLPVLLSYAAVAAHLDTLVAVIAAGLGIMCTGRTAWWSVPDLDGDRKAGDGTPAVRHGAARTTGTASATMAVGVAVVASGLSALLGFGLAAVAVAMHVVVLAIAIAPLTGARIPLASWAGKRVLLFVTLGELSLALVPLAAA